MLSAPDVEREIHPPTRLTSDVHRDWHLVGPSWPRSALATADVGIAIGAGTDVAIESAGIVLVRSDPRDVVGAIELSRAAYRKMLQNLVWATAYNLVAIPVAAGLFLRWGVELPMSVGAIAMSLSTLIVAAIAQFLRGLKLARA